MRDLSRRIRRYFSAAFYTSRFAKRGELKSCSDNYYIAL